MCTTRPIPGPDEVSTAVRRADLLLCTKKLFSAGNQNGFPKALIHKETGKEAPPVDHEEFAARTQAVRQRLYRTAYLYLGSVADALEAVDEAV